MYYICKIYYETPCPLDLYATANTIITYIHILLAFLSNNDCLYRYAKRRYLRFIGKFDNRRMIHSQLDITYVIK